MMNLKTWLWRASAHPTVLRWAIRLSPPLGASGVRLQSVARDWGQLRVSTVSRLTTRNHHGWIFGGSLCAMVDPFFGLMLQRRLGNDYFICDRGMSIRFVRPAKTDVTATFRLPEEVVEQIASDVRRHGTTEPVLTVDIVDAHGEVVAEVTRTVHVARRRRREVAA